MQLFQRMSVMRAILWSIVGAFLLLPKGTMVDLPMVPPLDKETLPNLTVFFVCQYVLGKHVPLFPKVASARVLMLIYIISPFITALLNSAPVITGPFYIKGMSSYDALSAVIRQFIFVLPFMLGLQFFKSEKALEGVLMVLALAGLWYSIPMLFEIRMSPQLNVWIYGYFPHSFGQQMRGDGFRPVVFIGHGLWVAFFTLTALISAVTFWKIKKSPLRQFSSGMVVAYLAVVLILCKSMASIIYAVFLAILVKFAKPKLQMNIALVMVVIALSYPLTRGLGWFPVQQISELASSMNERRAESFNVRVRNEDMLLDKTKTRPWFGWGSWGRNRVYDQITGKDITVTDGRWIIVFSQYGWMGLLAEFGLLALPVLRSRKTIRFLKSRREVVVMAAFTLILAIGILDLLPNNTMTPITWLMAGALLARTQQIEIDRKNKEIT